MSSPIFGGFEWDVGNSAKVEAHGMSRAEVESVFESEPLVGPDPFDPKIEKRWRAIGRTTAARLALVVFTIRERENVQLVRPISARYMHAKEAKKYDRDHG